MKSKRDKHTVSYATAADIQLSERDFALDLDAPGWPLKQHLPQWKGRHEQDGWLSRRIDNHTGDHEMKAAPEEGERLAGEISESILRFPSAPIHGLHRLHEYHVNEGESETFHTYRVFSHPKRRKGVEPRRIFLMHNGLNEAQSMSLYYRLASYLIHQDPEMRTVCLLRPLPGHLTRSRFAGFAETPLDHYLWDGSHLFRQFLRYMIETQWLLSILARRSSYRCMSGLNLLAESKNPDGSRLDDDVLAESIFEAWMNLHKASERAVQGLHTKQQNATPLSGPPSREAFDQTVSSLRTLLNLQLRLGGDLGSDDPPEPTVHVVGYSLGGFAAQSVFMSWPFLVASCSTLLSGGALRELAPTAFADPEEWQTVLHSLRYELDDAMLSGRYRFKTRGQKVTRAPVSGIDFDLFLFLKSTFYEVFQQEYRGSFQTRLASFRRRMLFVVGGNDPIVRPQSVLDSGPPDGINMVAIGRLGHFLGSKSRDAEEQQQRSFWLPEIGNLVYALADDAAENLETDRKMTWLDAEMNLPSHPADVSRTAIEGGQFAKSLGRLNAAERMAVESDGALSAELFQRCLDDLLSRADARRGVLFILRNEAPTALLDDRAIMQLAAGLHHDDTGISAYIEGLRRRKELILSNPERISLLLPWNIRNIMENMDAHPGHPSQSEGVGGHIDKRITPAKVWKSFNKKCIELAADFPNAVRICDGRMGVGDTSGSPPVDTAELAGLARKRLNIDDQARAVTPSLPDCWVWMSPEFLALDADEMLTVDAARPRLCKLITSDYWDQDALGNRLRREHLRIVTVSRSRYNPRFRGRVVVDPRAARTLLLHITLCIAVSAPFGEQAVSA